MQYAVYEAIPEELLPSFKAEYLAANELERQDESVAAEESFKEESSEEEELESSQESLHDATPSQEELAIKVGKKRPYISRVENGEDLRISNFIQIANVLGLNFELKPA